MPRKSPLKALDSLPIGLLKPLITPPVLELVKARLKLTDEKLALILVRLINPDELINEGEEAILRGVRPETLKKYKDSDDLPRHVNGI